MSNRRGANPLISQAFTLVEVMVVLLIIGVLAMLTVPRLIGSQGKAAEVEAVATRALLSQAAQRSVLSSEPFALNYNAQRQELSLQSLIEKEGDRIWGPVPLLSPVRFGSAVLTDATSDGQQQITPGSQGAGSDFRIEIGGSRPRGPISLLVRSAPDLPGTPRAWQIDLLPGQTVATLRSIPAEAPISPTQSNAIDLDAEGRRTQQW